MSENFLEMLLLSCIRSFVLAGVLLLLLLPPPSSASFRSTTTCIRATRRQRYAPHHRPRCWKQRQLVAIAATGSALEDLELEERLPNNDDREDLSELIRKAGFGNGDSLQKIALERISSDRSYCNAVYSIQDKNGGQNPPLAVAKLYSDLALSRMNPSRGIGLAEELVAEAGLGPKLLSSSNRGIVTEFCRGGRPLAESDLHRRSSTAVCRTVAASLARLHCIEFDGGEQPGENNNMLWRACGAMLDAIESPAADRRHRDGGSSNANNNRGWTVERLRQSVEYHRERLSDLDAPTVPMGHGDCKPSNILLSGSTPAPGEAESSSSTTAGLHLPNDSNSKVSFIDLELAGRNYRGFDIAKFFRSDQITSYTEKNREAFFQAYAVAFTSIEENDGHDLRTTADAIKDEAKLLLPMTWLEAAIFFVCMSVLDTAQGDRWSQLAADRLRSYELCCVR